MPRSEHPPFGQADLTNCERELIHLSGSVQPHGLLLVLSEPDLIVVQASSNVDALLGLEVWENRRVTFDWEKSELRVEGD